MESILSKEKCEMERTPEELIGWIDSIHEQIAADDVMKKYARTGKGLSKQFFEEIIPLGHLARQKYLGTPSLYLRPKIGNQNYDAEIIDRSNTPAKVRRIEFGSAYRDHDLALRLEYLTKHGGVPMTGSVEREGTKASGGQVKVQSDCETHENLLKKQFGQMEELISIKLSKSYEAGTFLALVLDDYLAFDLERDLPQLENFLSEKVLEPVLARFPGFFIIGASGRTFLEFGDSEGFIRLDPVNG